MLRMRRIRILGLAIGLCALALPAQSSRTWVSVLGSDANPGTREAPCRTFAGALAKTNAGGEIDALDTGEFGPVVITKAITIDGGGSLACIVSSGAPCVSINAPANDAVILRNLSIDAKWLSNGITFSGGRALTVAHCRITHGTLFGANIYLHTTSALFFDTEFIDCRTGIYFHGDSSASASLVNVRFQRNGTGVLAEGSPRYSAKNCLFTHHRGWLESGIALNESSMLVEHCVFSHNTIGIMTRPVSASLQISNCTLTCNDYAFRLEYGSTFISAGNNRLDGNVRIYY